jgi:hypothetical protein
MFRREHEMISNLEKISSATSAMEAYGGQLSQTATAMKVAMAFLWTLNNLGNRQKGAADDV